MMIRIERSVPFSGATATPAEMVTGATGSRCSPVRISRPRLGHCIAVYSRHD
jgi:hypothetical protein